MWDSTSAKKPGRNVDRAARRRHPGDGERGRATRSPSTVDGPGANRRGPPRSRSPSRPVRSAWPRRPPHWPEARSPSTSTRRSTSPPSPARRTCSPTTPRRRPGCPRTTCASASTTGPRTAAAPCWQNGIARTYLKFDNTSVLWGKNIISSALTLTQLSTSCDNKTYTINAAITAGGSELHLVAGVEQPAGARAGSRTRST